jgi:hypothetical protein
MNTNSVACEFQLQPSWKLSGKNLSLACRLPAMPRHTHGSGRAERRRRRARACGNLLSLSQLFKVIGQKPTN